MFNFFKRKPATYTLVANDDLGAGHLHDRVMYQALLGKTMTKDDWVDELTGALWHYTGIKTIDACHKKAGWMFGYYKKRGYIL